MSIDRMGTMETGQFIRRNVRGRQMRLRIIAFHLAAMLVVLSPLVAVEVLMRLCVPAPPVDPEDPYVSFTGLHPLFALNAAGTHFETAEERLAAFCRQSFAAVKAPNTFRIFCLGGSTVQVRPYSVQTSLTAWLALNLQAAQPDTDWEVINCGGISYASYRLVPIMEELLDYEPDVFVIYTGHNEFIEDRTYGRLKRAPRPLIRLHRALLHLRTYALADRWVADRSGTGGSKTVLGPAVRAKLDLEEGLGSYHRDAAWREGTLEQFRRNLEALVRMSRAADVPVILMNPVSNLKDSPPFKSEFRADLGEDGRQQVTDFMERAEGLDWSDTYGKIALLQKAVEIDDRHAGLLFRIGTCHHRLGRFAESKQWFLRAKEEDICPLRALEPMHEAIVETARRYGVPLVDVRSRIEGRTEDGIPGDEWLLDHVHPSIAGHQMIADALYRVLEEMQLVRTPESWQARRDALWHDHLASLGQAYFAQGAARLKRLRQWSRGRIPKEAPAP